MRSWPGPIAFYAASATVSDPDALANRYMPNARIVRSPGGRGIDYRIVPNLDQAIKAFREKGLKKALVFVNTPEEAESLVNGDLRRYFPPHIVRVHHGKLQASKRQEAERALRLEDRAVCACTSTLEVGVDIGDIDMVILANRPRSISSIAQRIGRGNRRQDRISTVAVARTSGEVSYYEKIFEAIVRSKYSSEEHAFDPSVVVQQTAVLGRQLRRSVRREARRPVRGHGPVRRGDRGHRAPEEGRMGRAEGGRDAR